MEFFKKYQTLLIAFFTVVLIGLGIWFNHSLKAQVTVLTEELHTKHDKLQEYYSNIQSAPSPYLINRLQREKIIIEGSYQSLVSRYAVLPVLTLPEGEIFPSLYYKETMYLILDDLRREAAQKGVALPSSLGITETGLPPAEEVPTLLIMLDTVKKLCAEVFKSRLFSVGSIQLGAPVANPQYIEIPLTISVSGSSSRVAYFYEKLGSSSTIFILQNMQMARSDNMVQASLSLKRLIWAPGLVEKIKLVTPSGTSTGGGPAGGAVGPEMMPPPPPEMMPPPPQ